MNAVIQNRANALVCQDFRKVLGAIAHQHYLRPFSLFLQFMKRWSGIGSVALNPDSSKGIMLMYREIISGGKGSVRKLNGS